MAIRPAQRMNFRVSLHAFFPRGPELTRICAISRYVHSRRFELHRGRRRRFRNHRQIDSAARSISGTAGRRWDVQSDCLGIVGCSPAVAVHHWRQEIDKSQVGSVFQSSLSSLADEIVDRVRLQNIAPHLDNAISLAIYSVTEGESLDELIETTGAFSDATGGVLTVEFRVAASLSGQSPSHSRHSRN